LRHFAAAGDKIAYNARLGKLKANLNTAVVEEEL
jgi:hypothetical protein